MSGDILVELSAYDTNLASLVTFRFGSVGYNDPSAPGFYEPRLVQPLTFRRDMFGANTTGGASRISYGEVRLANDDGGIDNLRNYGFAGQNVSLLIGDATGPYSGFTSLIIGRIQQVLFDLKGVTIQLRDRLLDLAVPIQANKYLGNNVLPNGLEGGADLQDRPKPLLFGVALNIQPPCVNTSRLEYQVNDGAINLVLAVYDAGAVLTAGADYVSQVDMETNAPAAGNYRTWKAGGYFRLGTTPSGAITCDVREGANAADRTAAQIAKRIVTYTGGIASGDVNASDVTALDTANSGILGIWINDEAQFGAALDAILGSVGAWYGFDRLGKFRMQRLEAPGGSPVRHSDRSNWAAMPGRRTSTSSICGLIPATIPIRASRPGRSHWITGKAGPCSKATGWLARRPSTKGILSPKPFARPSLRILRSRPPAPWPLKKKSRPSSSISRTRQPKPAGY
jgi:hypothetical protein